MFRTRISPLHGQAGRKEERGEGRGRKGGEGEEGKGRRGRRRPLRRDKGQGQETSDKGRETREREQGEKRGDLQEQVADRGRAGEGPLRLVHLQIKI